MGQQKIKILLAKPGLDGHDVGVKVLGHALKDEGFDLVYSGLRKSVEEIVRLAMTNNVGVIGLSILSGTHLIICVQMDTEMKKNNFTIPWVVGGNIPDEDVDAIKASGAAEAFPTGTSIQTVVDYFKDLEKS